MPAQIAVICFLAEFVTRSLSQVGFMLQKLSHRDAEKKATMSDNVNSMKTYGSGKFALGASLVILNAIVQALVLP